jgi:hypothetical protein
MPFLVNKQEIQNEVAALKQHGYSANVSTKMRRDGTPILTIDITPIGQAQGISITIVPEILYFTGDYAAMSTLFNTNELNAFIKSFPKSIAPIIAAGRESNPPVPIDNIQHHYDNPKPY